MEKAYLNKADILERLKISRKTLDRWMKKGEIPYIKLGYVIRFDWEKVQEAFEKNERKATF